MAGRPAPPKQFDRVAGHVIAALHRNLLDRVRHVLDRDADEAVGDFLGRFVADLGRHLGEGVAHRVGIQRFILLTAEYFRKEFRQQFSDHHIGVGDGERTAAPE